MRGTGRLTVALFREFASNVAIERARRASEELRDAKQPVARNHDPLPSDRFVTVHQRVRIVSDVKDRELAGFGDQPTFFQRRAIDAFDELH